MLGKIKQVQVKVAIREYRSKIESVQRTANKQ